MDVEEAPQAHEPDLLKKRPLSRSHLTATRRTCQVLPERAVTPLMSAMGRKRTSGISEAERWPSVLPAASLQGLSTALLRVSLRRRVAKPSSFNSSLPSSATRQDRREVRSAGPGHRRRATRTRPYSPQRNDR